METKIMHNLILENEKTYSEKGKKLGLNWFFSLSYAQSFL